MIWQDIKNWTIVAFVIFISIGSIILIVDSDSFSIMLNDGTMKAKYSEGNLKVYSGRNIAFEDYINIYYWNGEGYTTMYKARGEKYSNLSYYTDGDITFIKQQIRYSRGNLTRYFEISEYNIKESFEWQPDDKSLKVYFLWTYDKLDEYAEKQVYFDKNTKLNNTLMDFNIINDWEKDIDKIIRVERFQNGRLKIRTKVFKGNAIFDPDIKLKPELKTDDVFKKLKVNDMKNKRSIFSMDSPAKLNKNALQFRFDEVCGKVLDYKVMTNNTCIREVDNPIYENRSFCSDIIDEIDNTVIGEECTNANIVIGYGKINESYVCMKELDEISKGEFDYEISANIQMEQCDDGTFGYKVDWIPSLQNAAALFTQDKWAWWNASYDYKRDITDEPSSAIAFSVNATGGFCDNLIWTNPRDDNLSIYYDNCTSFKIIANDTSVADYEIEPATVIDYEPFDSDVGGWTQATFDTDDWLWKGSAPLDSSSTGPNEVYDGGYMIVETSGGDCNDPDTAVLYLSPAIDFNSYNDVNIKFAYNMIGTTMGTLHIKENSTGSWVSLWNKSGDQGSSWLIANEKISVTGTGNIAIWMDCGASFTSDAAIDSVMVTADIGNNPTEIYSNDRVGAWHFGINSSAVSDSTSNANDGSTTSATWITNGKFGNAYNFVTTSSSFILVPNDITLDSRSFSMGYWLRVDNANAAGHVIRKITGGAGDTWRMFLTTNPLIEFDGAGEVGNIRTNVLSLDTWYHIVGVYDDSANTMKIYQDSSLIQTATNVTITNNNTHNLEFGRPSVGTFNGSLDEIFMYNKSLSLTEIEELYNNSVSGRNMVFGNETSAPVGDTCTCPGGTTAHEFDCSDGCNMTSCTVGAVTFTGTGTINCNGTWDISSLGDPGSGCILYVDSACDIDE